MKKINLNGCTTAELLIKLKEAYEQLFDAVEFTKLFTVDDDYNEAKTFYSVSTIRNGEIKNGSIVYFNNAYIAIVKNKDNSSFAVEYAVRIIGPKGEQGEKGDDAQINILTQNQVELLF